MGSRIYTGGQVLTFDKIIWTIWHRVRFNLTKIPSRLRRDFLVGGEGSGVQTLDKGG